ncbi:MAG: alpha/beta hydrolase [Microthrixaceae bacterium]
MLFDTIPLGAAILAWFTLMAVAPIRRPRPLASLAWVSSSTVNEAPVVFIAIVGLSVVPELLDHGGSSVGGQIGLALNVLTIVGLAVVTRRALGTRRSLIGAFDSTFGREWRFRLDPGLVSRLGRRWPTVRSLVAPWPIRPRSVERVADIPYGHDVQFGRNGTDSLLDVYRHRSHPTGAPTLVHLHGGRFRGGNKSREARALLHHLASRGWTCISANYRLARTPGDGFPGHLIDVKRVLAWARAHADEHGIAPNTIVLCGSSAGAHLTAMAALTANDRALQPGFEQADTSMAAAVCFYGYYGALGNADGPPSTPLAHDAADAPPFLILHGSNDTYTPVEGARMLADHLDTRSSNRVVVAELPGAQHSFDIVRSPRFDAVIDAVEVFGLLNFGRDQPVDAYPRAEE